MRDWPKANERDFPLLQDLETEASGGSLTPFAHLFIPNDPHLPNLPDSAWDTFDSSLSHSPHQPVTKFPPLSHFKIPPTTPFPCSLWLACPETLVRDFDRLLPVWSTLTSLLEPVLPSSPCSKHPLPIKCESQYLMHHLAPHDHFCMTSRYSPPMASRSEHILPRLLHAPPIVP